jgi:MFS family permease
LGPYGGAIADAVDRRKLVLLTSGMLILVSLLFALQAALELRQVWLLYALTALQSCFSAIGAPASRAFVPRLLPRERIAAAASLSQLSFQTSILVGPLLAGAIIATAGLRVAYVVDAASFVCSFYAVLRLPPIRVQGGGTPPGFRAVAEGLRFVRNQPVIGAVLLVDIMAMVFGMPRALFPALAETHFGGGPQAVGLLFAAPAIGGVLCAGLSGSLSHVRRQGMAVLLAAAVWGAACAGFALMSQLWLGVLLLAIAGGADMVTGVFRSTILQVNSPDFIRGRIGSVGLVVDAGGPRLGDVESGVIAALTSPVISAVSGGLACVVGVALIGLAIPAFTHYDSEARAKEAQETSASPAP